VSIGIAGFPLSFARVFFAFLLFWSIGCNSADASRLEIFLAVAGKDDNTGLSADSPVASFEKALAIARAKLDSKSEIAIHFAPGNYGPRTLNLNWFPKNGRSLVLDGGGGAARASFDGGNGDATWLVVRGQRGQETHIVIRGFRVSNYRGAISFYGNRFDNTPWSAKNIIEKNIFENIGQKRLGAKIGFSAITLTNSVENTISGNKFKDITNLEKCDAIHAIYLSGGSSRNSIIDNVFDGGCGDTIKARDRSNHNVILNNKFYRQTGKAIFVDSFCDGKKVAECALKPQECPSWGNVFRDNFIDDQSRRSMRTITRSTGRLHVESCPAPQGGRQQRILH